MPARKASLRFMGPVMGTVLGALLALACQSGTDSEGNRTGSGGDGGTGTGGNGTGGNGTGGSGGADPDVPAPSTRAARLTHAQWENTVRDLFRLDEDVGSSSLFRGDPRVAGFLFDNNALALEVDQALWIAYQRAAVGVAELITESPELLDAILPPDDGDETARARAFVIDFGLRAQRRPLSDAEIEDYLAIFEKGRTLFTGVPAFQAGIRLLLEAFLQAPAFLYRLEPSAEVTDGVIPLDDWEVAQRLSYFLWDSMPDDELFEAARAGRLRDPAELSAQAVRLLADDRARGVVRHFHEQLFELERYAGIKPSTDAFPEVSEELGTFARTENELFIEDVVVEKRAGYRELLTSTDTFVNSELARIYGLDGSFGDEFTPVSLDPNERRGLLTQIGFLASHATSVHPDPIHRGVFLLRRVTCTGVAAPPDNVPPLPPIEDTTNREAVAKHTEQPGTACINCHGLLINPLGFPFENYDAIGGYRTMDNGFPVDAASDPLIGDDTVHVENALDLATALAESSAVHECYAKHWIEFSQGRPSAAEDEKLALALASASHMDDLPILGLMQRLVEAPAFIARNKEELP